jgi:hypothetical protein
MNGYDHPSVGKQLFFADFTTGSMLCAQAEIHITEEAFTRACSNLSQASQRFVCFHRVLCVLRKQEFGLIIIYSILYSCFVPKGRIKPT